MERISCKKDTNTINFCGLNRILKTRPLRKNQAFFEMLPDIFTRENGNVGSLPNDIIALIPKSSELSKADMIKKFQDIINRTNEILSAIEVQKLIIADETNPKNLITPFLPKLAKIEIQPERISKTFNEMRRRLTPDKEYLAFVSNNAAAFMETEFKQLGILRPTDSIRMTYAGQGKFKNAFKLEIIDEKGENIIHPKAVLSFKEKSIAHQQLEKLLELIKAFYDSTTEKQYRHTVDNLLKYASRKVVPEDMIEKYRAVLSDMFIKIKYFMNGEDIFRDLLDKTIRKEINFNGIEAESNITQFIKHAAGSPMIDSNFVPFYYLNLKHNIALAEFADSALGIPTHEIQLHKYGLFHDDLDLNKDNIVLGRVVDDGNIKILPGYELLAVNSNARRLYHKFSQIKFKDKNRTFRERIKYWNDMYTKAINHKIPNHNDILEGLQLCKRQLPAEYHYKLLDSGSDAFY